MTLHIDVTPELEAKLREQAAACGKAISDVAREALEEKYISREQPNVSGVDATIERRRAELRSWAESHRSLGYVADDSRESIYEGRGE